MATVAVMGEAEARAAMVVAAVAAPTVVEAAVEVPTVEAAVEVPTVAVAVAAPTVVEAAVVVADRIDNPVSERRARPEVLGGLLSCNGCALLLP